MEILNRHGRRTALLLTAAAAIAAGIVLWTNAKASGEADHAHAVSNELEMAFTVTEPVVDSDDDGGSSSPAPSPVTEQITVIIDGGNTNGGTISSASINRTTLPDGTKRDEVVFPADKAAETVEHAVRNGQQTARIVIPDDRDEVSEVNVSIPVETLDILAEGKLNLEIFTENASITLPVDSLTGLKEDLYFRVVPIKEQSEREVVEERARTEQAVRISLGNGDVEVVGRPMTIETNLSSRQADIVLPLRDVTLPEDPEEREQFLAGLVIFIEHSDGEKKVVKPEVVPYQDGQLGLKFTIMKFSTFTILDADIRHHAGYITGYPDGMFKPERSVSRAEMAMLLSRLDLFKAAGSAAAAYSDLASDHWAADAIRGAAASGWMQGYEDGTFRPERAVTRAEMAAIVSRWASNAAKKTTSVTPSKDIAGHWAEAHIMRAAQAGVLAGLPDGSFEPDRTLSRAEAVVILNRLAGRGPLQGLEAPRWSDVPASHWAVDEIHEASVGHGYLLNADEGYELLLIAE